MLRSFIAYTIFYILFTNVLFQTSDAVRHRTYSKSLMIRIKTINFDDLATGIADIVRQAFKHGLNRFINRQSAYDSDVFRYTLASQHGYGGLFAGEACRLSPMMCSHDEQCCTGRCLCRRWLIIGEERCIRKCF